MGQAPGDLAPGRDLLGPDERRDVIQHQYPPFGQSHFRRECCCCYGKVDLAPFAVQGNLLGGCLARRRCRSEHEIGQRLQFRAAEYDGRRLPGCGSHR